MFRKEHHRNSEDGANPEAPSEHGSGVASVFVMGFAEWSRCVADGCWCVFMFGGSMLVLGGVGVRAGGGIGVGRLHILIARCFTHGLYIPYIRGAYVGKDIQQWC